MKKVSTVNSESSAEYQSESFAVPRSLDLAQKFLLEAVKNEDDIIAAAIKIIENRYLRGEALTSSDKCKNFLRLKFGEREHEVFSIVHLDNQHRVTHVEEMFRGTIDGAAVYPREVVKSCLMKNSAAVIFCHNHPSGTATPSNADIEITKKLKKALDTVDIRVLDHVIVSQIEAVSFSERGLM